MISRRLSFSQLAVSWLADSHTGYSGPPWRSGLSLRSPAWVNRKQWKPGEFWLDKQPNHQLFRACLPWLCTELSPACTYTLWQCGFSCLHFSVCAVVSCWSHAGKASQVSNFSIFCFIWVLFYGSFMKLLTHFGEFDCFYCLLAGV